MRKLKLFVFTGAGISAESGVKTFRDSGGLWEEFSVDEVASIDGWRKDKQKVIDFYNRRRNEMSNVLPNKAHEILAQLEDKFDITIVTQNVDDLHERAGSKNVIHLHGELSKLQSEDNSEIISEWKEDLKLGDKGYDGHQLRPNIVWFGENLNPLTMEKVTEIAFDADVCLIIGTSMKVAPANSIPWLTRDSALIYYIDPGDIEFYIPYYRNPFFYHIKEVATLGVEKVKNELIDIF